MGKEIEIRNKLLSKEDVLNFFDKRGIKPSVLKHQIDTYYDNPEDSLFKDPNNINIWIRIREENGKLIFTYKHWLPEEAKIKTYCEEKEYPMNSKQELPKYLKELGFNGNFVPFIVTDKKRQCFAYKDCEIAIDEVKGLGSYIEIEYKGKNNDDVDMIRKFLNEVLIEINAKVGPADQNGYAYQIFKKQKIKS